MRNRGGYRKDRSFNEGEHPSDAHGRFVDDDESEEYGRRYSRGYYGQGGYERGRYSGGHRRDGGGRHFGEGGLTCGGGWNERDYSGSESRFGYPEEGRRSSRGWRGLGGIGEAGDFRGFGGESPTGYQYGLGGQGMPEEDDEGLSDYHHWRDEQMKKFDSDYDEWRKERRRKFAEDFDKWLGQRATAGKTEDAGKK